MVIGFIGAGLVLGWLFCVINSLYFPAPAGKQTFQYVSRPPPSSFYWFESNPSAGIINPGISKAPAKKQNAENQLIKLNKQDSPSIKQHLPATQIHASHYPNELSEVNDGSS